jgi:flagellar biogenesis protein FliO
MIFSVVYIKPLNSIFKTIPLDGKMLSLSILLAIISAAWWEIVKLFNNRIGR